MRKSSLLIFLLLIGSCAFAQTIKDSSDLQLIDGFLYGNVSEKNELERNNIYKRGSIYTYSFIFWDKNGNELFFNINNDHSWDFVAANKTSGDVVKDFKLEILNSNMNFSNPAYYQTGISYIINKNKIEHFKTGLIENEKNIWLHPPREYLFQILQLNPYPYIKFPLEVGHNWNWRLSIGSAWGDKRWKEWTGIIENSYVYRIVEKKQIQTKIGMLDCFIVESEAISVLGKTKLTSYFNDIFGFVKLDYTNIDGSRLEINIQKVEGSMLKFF